ncbi:hypothetical protein [Anaerosphaera multitolerans]|uniref:ATPase n=1 Tax=Anaerosphaera multitolerans TaxID=2487351 RepID=A0A437S987_9FIRM|nr:hypothetical protein [Anaerosphaera multitolerans]RVU55676.1 hypothetical protein EF514_00225 [Anaerosphaera multitolerans]
MILLENKINIFEKIVFLDKERECREKLKAEQDRIKIELQSKEKELEDMKSEVISRRIHLAKRQGSERITQANEEGRILELQKDEELLSELIQELCEKAFNFTKTEEYEYFIEGVFKRAIEDIGPGEYKVEILKEDEEKFTKKFREIGEKKGMKLEFQELSLRDIGGFTLSNFENTYVIDCTLRNKIEDSRYDIGKLLHFALKKAGEDK